MIFDMTFCKIDTKLPLYNIIVYSAYGLGGLNPILAFGGVFRQDNQFKVKMTNLTTKHLPGCL